MKISTWNLNSINARIDHLIKFIKSDQSDIYLLQELKSIEDNFPKIEIKNLGYHCYVNGQKAWNGVAILSKKELPIINTKIPPTYIITCEAAIKSAYKNTYRPATPNKVNSKATAE